MSGIADEKYLSRRGGTGDFSWEERDFIVRGSDDTVEIDDAALSIAPTTIAHTDGILYRTGIRNRQQDGNGIWTVTVGYESDEFELAIGQKRHRWSTVGGTQHVLHAKAHVSTYDSGGSGVSHGMNGVLGWDGKSALGADIVVGAFGFEVDIALGGISGLAATCASLTAHVNNATFYGFAAGEVMFFGATRSDRGNGINDVTFFFGTQENQTGVTVGSSPGISGVDIPAWHILSLEPLGEADDGTIKRVFVDRVYDSGNFSLLGIGTSE